MHVVHNQDHIVRQLHAAHELRGGRVGGRAARRWVGSPNQLRPRTMGNVHAAQRLGHGSQRQLSPAGKLSHASSWAASGGMPTSTPMQRSSKRIAVRSM